ncbi:Maf-like protein [Bacteroides caecigallinarum]|uniref:Maf-like protein n=1 Tax=Bacteroides caecigallinarum TaxID=1411144 RepID=UPI00195EC138|nr:Maf-like protein [Bacteroides caecigallinarum]MBM6883797.1 septum formation protein Maf [Bacteroides caecigallinarum]MBM6889353.1 septum formation protein Maf [Bacteroides caecigallinarum]MCF2550639.1 septum formation protein Maf [Bacteroides caecigallinarum]
MLDNLKKYNIILASNSPRRRELLTGLGLDYEVKLIKGIDESYPPHLKGDEIPIFISRIKAASYRPVMAENDLVITADTIVYADGEVLGKPKDRDDAVRMLKILSGHTHQVMTGVSITTRDFQRSFASVSDVTFDNLTDEEIYFYIDNYKPYDKAGAYGIQEWIGFIGVSGIRGSYFNVMGLPVQRLYKELCSIE